MGCTRASPAGLFIYREEKALAIRRLAEHERSLPDSYAYETGGPAV